MERKEDAIRTAAVLFKQAWTNASETTYTLPTAPPEDQYSIAVILGCHENYLHHAKIVWSGLLTA
jgi:hypothetical protein